MIKIIIMIIKIIILIMTITITTTTRIIITTTTIIIKIIIKAINVHTWITTLCQFWTYLRQWDVGTPFMIK